ncbi:hypothetical protein THARTR1_04765 [Trichoderma harzianum]|uniref:Uncharacterized protein n=1 Tax=Trichoderma harzianum TaxID=5544 RepID=A0A2K0UBC3_TRIHA|nr:hypothetical protein THARTR1_04765 [Trichoderma harzianum]
MVDTSQPNHRAGRQHQAQSTNASNTNASDADLQRQNDINRLLHIDIAAVESQVTLNEWLLETIQLFYQRLEQFESVDDVEGKQRLIDWMLEQFDAWDALPRFNPRTLQVEDRTAAEQNAALTRVTNRLSRLNQRIDQLEERIPEDDEHWARVLEMTREAADAYLPPRHGPPQHVPFPSNPHQYGPEGDVNFST